MQLVIAHYQEDLSWLEDYRSIPAIVYRKGGSGPNQLPNVGREAHTYLHHIIENYDNLAEVTVFLQGDPRDHVPALFEKLCSLDSATRYQELSDLVLSDDRIGRPPQPGLPLAAFYEKLFNVQAPDYYCCRVGACFAVNREVIRQRSREFYQHAMELVLTEDCGPWCIERLWHLIFRTESATEGIVTAADAGYFRDLQFFIRSCLAVSRHPICVVDLGLTESQRNWCLDAGNVIVWAPPELFQPMQKIQNQFWWQAWLKPFYMEYVPFDRLLWIDADCVVLKPLEPLFDQLDKSPVFIRDGTTVATENDPRLYDYLPLSAGTQTGGINLNSGVVGLCKFRDRNILSAWVWASQWLGIHTQLQPLSSWADQGLLLWATLHTSAAKHIRLDLNWNQPVFQENDLLSESIRRQHSLVDELRWRYPDASIVHFLGPHKLSRQLDDQIQRAFF